jgi:hypothetical protein
MRVSQLFVYPVKSCRGIAVTQMPVLATGLQWDRHWMITRPDGRFITQREVPRLALIETALTPQALVLRHGGAPALHVPFLASGAPCRVVVWRDTVSGIDCGDAAADWLFAALGEELRLVRFDPATPRYSNRQFTGEIAATTEFADGFALLIVSEASLADLNARINGTPLPMNRFRPNLVLADVPAYAEDGLRELEFGALRLRIVKPCVRCSITTTDQATAAVTSAEPLRTLKSYRFDRGLMGVTFGQNAIVVDGAGGLLAVGMEPTRAV